MFDLTSEKENKKGKTTWQALFCSLLLKRLFSFLIKITCIKIRLVFLKQQQNKLEPMHTLQVIVPKTSETLKKTVWPVGKNAPKIFNLIILHLIWQHTSCLLWLMVLLYKTLFCCLFFKLYSTLYRKVRGPVKLLPSDCQKRGHVHPKVSLNSTKTGKNRPHGTLTTRPKISTKSNREGCYCTVTQKSCIFQ